MFFQLSEKRGKIYRKAALAALRQSGALFAFFEAQKRSSSLCATFPDGKPDSTFLEML